MLLIADSGSTKTTWLFSYDDGKIREIRTIGLNPNYCDREVIISTINEFIKPEVNRGEKVQLYFYGSGCGGDESVGIVESALSELLTEATVSVGSDLLGAARSLLGNGSGIVSILGTGSNSGFYNGFDIITNIPPLGFILGDEGGGTYMGKRILADYLKGIMPAKLASEFEKRYSLDKEIIISRVYRGEFPAKYVSGFVNFMSETIENDYIKDIITSSFQDFIDRNIRYYQDFENMSICFTGSVAWIFRSQLKEVLIKNRLTSRSIVKNPARGILNYHLRLNREK